MDENKSLNLMDTKSENAAFDKTLLNLYSKKENKNNITNLHSMFRCTGNGHNRGKRNVFFFFFYYKLYNTD